MYAVSEETFDEILSNIWAMMNRRSLRLFLTLLLRNDYEAKHLDLVQPIYTTYLWDPCRYFYLFPIKLSKDKFGWAVKILWEPCPHWKVRGTSNKKTFSLVTTPELEKGHLFLHLLLSFLLSFLSSHFQFLPLSLYR